MPIRHTWTLLLLLMVALAPASARQEQLCHELISALQSDAGSHAATGGVADEENARGFLSHLLSRSAGIFCTARGESATPLSAMWLDERLDWIETEKGERLWKRPLQPVNRDVVERSLGQAPLAEVEWRRKLLAIP